MPFVGIGTLPTPFLPASVPLPPETGGRGHTSLRVGGWGESQFRRGAYTVVLFICTYTLCTYRTKYPACPHKKGILFSYMTLHPIPIFLNLYRTFYQCNKIGLSTGIWKENNVCVHHLVLIYSCMVYCI